MYIYNGQQVFATPLPGGTRRAALQSRPGRFSVVPARLSRSAEVRDYGLLFAPTGAEVVTEILNREEETRCVCPRDVCPFSHGNTCKNKIRSAWW